MIDHSLFDYNERLRKETYECYEIAKKARAMGLDVSDEVEIPIANDMAERVEELIHISGIAGEIRELSKSMSREELSLHISKKVASLLKDNRVEALDKAVRVGLAILTEGILVAPLEGIKDVKINKNDDGTEYVSIVYSGPIRSAGGTAQALSVLIADIVRRELNIGSFSPTDDEIERYIEEVEAYNRLKHLQYMPTPDEIRLVLKNSPVMIDGEGSEEEEVSGHRDMKRITTNRIRGGMCLVLCEGLIQKAKKVLKYTNVMHLNEWNILENIGKNKSDEKTENKSEKYLKDIIAGRPVFGYPNRPGGFRLRYGRSRISGLAAASINPVTMKVLNDFIAIGSQIKVELPGKAAAITPCDSINGPMVLTRSGDHIKVKSIEQAEKIKNDIERITDLGEILIAYGDFLENNRNLDLSPFTREWWEYYLNDELSIYKSRDPDQFDAVNISRKYKIPMFPGYDYFWHDITMEELNLLINAIANGIINDDSMMLDASVSEILIKLGIEFKKHNNKLILHEYYPLIVSCGFDLINEKIVKVSDERKNDVLGTVNALSGIEIKPRAPVRVGARLGRPEKAGDRKMKPKVHGLFPLMNYGGSTRSIINAARSGSIMDIELGARICRVCGTETPFVRCPKCGMPTEDSDSEKKFKIDISKALDDAALRVSTDIGTIKELKGVKKLMSRRSVIEPLEKAILRAKHGISINKDGTCRYDMSDIPITHFKYNEISLTRQRLMELGYSDSDINEIYPQDIIIPRDAASYLLNVSKFIDDLLVNYYGLGPYYMCNSEDDLIGHLVIGLAPHTSGGIVGRIIGFSDVNGCYAHPFFHAAKRRNCDGDEDSIMLLLDGLLNFSKKYLPSTTGGLMDAPLVLTLILDPEEIDKEALNVDTLQRYPLDFYIATEKNAPPASIENMMKTMKVLIRDGRYTGISYSFDTGDISSGTRLSAYKTIGSMEEKIEKQLGLARILRSVDENDVAARVLSSHFLPDIYGNFRSFFTQEFRCTKCNAKYRRVPLSGRCLRCGSSNIILTIHHGSIVKYLNETKKVMNEYKLPDYLVFRINRLLEQIESTFDIENGNDTTLDALIENE
ncbi:DNA polymerase II large subunit [Picrophilus oshimae]|uniref:DNA polymerase II large subunit n=1 Tax=Picrophilus torridus (strain ATCC 700027 / DSM 9790 / JCM 10055 / NBRC 100828 / KAW 2/3) TaxID=1122961 RepID=A0A8G2FW42_PICTO|nr:DNA polymerase II large subunit [Picrophilus oshimae]SMD30549.1 DNA polymerase II large subunit [Picrophilus oshimae DSM 9789]